MLRREWRAVAFQASLMSATLYSCASTSNDPMNGGGAGSGGHTSLAGSGGTNQAGGGTNQAGGGTNQAGPTRAQILKHLRRAHEIAIRSVSAGHHPFGALLVGPDQETVLLEQGNLSTVNRSMRLRGG